MPVRATISATMRTRFVGFVCALTLIHSLVRSAGSRVVGAAFREKRFSGRTPAPSLYESQRVTEMRVFRGPQPLEYDHLRGHDLRSIPLHAPDGCFLAFRAARTKRVAHDKNVPPRTQQTQNGLQNTDMGFASRNDEIGPIGQLFEKARCAAGVEGHFMHDAAGTRSELRHGCAEAADVLLGV